MGPSALAWRFQPIAFDLVFAPSNRVMQPEEAQEHFVFKSISVRVGLQNLMNRTMHLTI
jgi:hypothetical protein